MKLIIDIPEDVRIAISQMGLLRIPDEMQKNVDKAIQHGTPLEQIRAEIEQIADEEQKHDGNWAIGLRYAIKIIDKYRGGIRNERF